MLGSDIVSVCNVCCHTQPLLGHWANKTPLWPALGREQGTKTKKALISPSEPPPNPTLTYTPLQKKSSPVKTHHTSARSAEACLQLSAHHAGIPGRLCPAKRLMLPRNIWQRTGRLWKSECKLACQVWREERGDGGGGVDKENATRWKAAADGWETLL